MEAAESVGDGKRRPYGTAQLTAAGGGVSGVLIFVPTMRCQEVESPAGVTPVTPAGDRRGQS